MEIVIKAAGTGNLAGISEPHIPPNDQIDQQIEFSINREIAFRKHHFSYPSIFQF